MHERTRQRDSFAFRTTNDSNLARKTFWRAWLVHSRLPQVYRTHTHTRTHCRRQCAKCVWHDKITICVHISEVVVHQIRASCAENSAPRARINRIGLPHYSCVTHTRTHNNSRHQRSPSSFALLHNKTLCALNAVYCVHIILVSVSSVLCQKVIGRITYDYE